MSLAFSKQGYVYCIPASDQWIDLRQIRVSNGAQSFITANLLDANSIARISPSGNSIYWFDLGSFPSTLHWLDVGTVPVTTTAVRSLIGWSYSVGGAGLWYDEMGRLICGAGTLFSVTETGSSTTDMQYVGTLTTALGSTGAKWVDHRSAATWGSATSLYAVIPANTYYSSTTTADTQVVLVAKADLSQPAATIPLPWFIQGVTTTQAHGYFTFWKADGSELYTIIKSDGASDASHYDLVVY
jgi:hypothetical protein